jgi:large subunit ribosomal protein L29
MKAVEIRELTLKELQERIDTEKSAFAKLKLNHAISPLDNPLKIKASRRSIARMMTVLRQKQQNENK